MLESPREIEFMPMRPGDRGWHLHTYNDNVGSAAIMVPTYGSTFAQLAADDEIVIYSASTDTTQTVTVFGIDSAGRKAKEEVIVAGTAKVSGLITFSFIEAMTMDIQSANIIACARDNTSTYTYIMELEAASLWHPPAHHFNGECESYITFFAGGTYDAGNDLMLELRWYPNDEGSRGTATKSGYEVVDRLFTATESLDMAPHIYAGAGIGPFPPGGWFAVYGVGSTTKGWVTLQGFDREV